MRLGSVPSCSATRAQTSQTSSSPSSKYQHDGPRASGVDHHRLPAVADLVKQPRIDCGELVLAQCK